MSRVDVDPSLRGEIDIINVKDRLPRHDVLFRYMGPVLLAATLFVPGFICSNVVRTDPVIQDHRDRVTPPTPQPQTPVPPG